MTRTPEQIADGLSEAMRGVLASTMPYPQGDQISFYLEPVNASNARALERRGLARMRAIVRHRLTRSGEAVRDVILSRQEGGR